jgi:hypothetical protein
MDTDALSFWADVAAIFLLVQVILVTLGVGVGLGFGWWYLRKGRKALGMPFLYAQVYALRVQRVTMVVTDKIAAVPISVESTLVGVRATVRKLVRG